MSRVVIILYLYGWSAVMLLGNNGVKTAPCGIQYWTQHVYDNLEWPISHSVWSADPTPANLLTPNNNHHHPSRVIFFCIVDVTNIWSRYKMSTSEDLVLLLLRHMELYIDVNFVQVFDRHSCQLHYFFRPIRDERVIGQYNILNNTIIVDISKTGSPYDRYQITMHETLHALGLGHHRPNAPSVMTPVLEKKNQLIYNADIAGLFQIWGRSQKKYLSSVPPIDFYDTRIIIDSRSTSIGYGYYECLLEVV